jgi:hypothetical protein
MAAKVRRCARCDRRLRKSGADWTCWIKIDPSDGLGTVPEVYCPDCTTTEEHLQREVNDATVDYRWLGERLAMYPKIHEAV